MDETPTQPKGSIPAQVKDSTATEDKPAECPQAPLLDKSTPRGGGPRTARGKARSSKNALKQGFFSNRVPIKSPFFKEDRTEFLQLLKALQDDWKPVGASEEIQVELAAISLFQYRRVLRVLEALILKQNVPPVPNVDILYDREYYNLKIERQSQVNESSKQAAAKYEMGEEEKLMVQAEERAETLYRCEFERAEKLKAEHQRIDKLGKTLPKEDDLDWLLNSGERILRQYYRATAEIERLQRLHLGDKVPPRLVVEVRND